MSDQEIEVLVVGAGQAGIAMSEHLSAQRRDAPRPRARPDRRAVALGAVGLPGRQRARLARPIPRARSSTSTPTRSPPRSRSPTTSRPTRRRSTRRSATGVEVTSVRRNDGRPGFRVETSDGTFDARYVVAATGRVPAAGHPGGRSRRAPASRRSTPARYRNPDQLPAGAVLVVGAGSSGVQIADELRSRAARSTSAVGPHDRPPRSYRGRDFCWWLGVLGKWDAATPPRGAEHVTIAVSGAHGGHTVDFRGSRHQRHHAGRAVTESFDDGVMRFAPDLRVNIDAR